MVGKKVVTKETSPAAALDVGKAAMKVFERADESVELLDFE